MGILDPWASCVSLQAQDLVQEEAHTRVVSTRSGQDAAVPIFLTSTGAVGRVPHPPGCTRHKDAGVTCTSTCLPFSTFLSEITFKSILAPCSKG